MSYSKGTKVKWNWASGVGTGEVVNAYTSEVTLEIKGTEVTRKATDDCPAYRIQQEDGSIVLKSHSELERA